MSVFLTSTIGDSPYHVNDVQFRLALDRIFHHVVSIMDTERPHVRLLCSLGYSEKQAAIYLALLQTGETTVAALAKRAGLKRPTTYVILGQLLQDGIVAERETASRTLYRALSPQLLLERTRLNAATLEAQIPALLQLNPSHSSTPLISYFAGPDGVERSMRERLQASTELLFWADNNLQFTHRGLAHGAQLDYMTQRIKKKIWTRGLIPYDPDLSPHRNRTLFRLQQRYLRMKHQGRSSYREFVFIPRGTAVRTSEIWIFDDKVDFYSTLDFVGARIQNAAYADSMRTIFYAQLAEANHSEDWAVRNQN